MLQKDYDNSISYFNQCLIIAKSLKNARYISSAQVSLGSVYLLLGDYKQSIFYSQRGMIDGKITGSPSLSKEASLNLYQANKILGHSDKALHFYEEYIKFNDSLNSMEVYKDLQRMEFNREQLLDSIRYEKNRQSIELSHKEALYRQKYQTKLILLSAFFLLISIFFLCRKLRYTKKSNVIISKEKDRSEKLLLNILPEEIAEELKLNGEVMAKNFSNVSILFSDFKSFTEVAEKLSADELVQEIDVCFRAFDLIVEKYKVEKIKTIGDSYMIVGGAPQTSSQLLIDLVYVALEMQEFMIERKLENQKRNKAFFEMRVGIHCGSIVAGIVGLKKFQYDVWGDAVNTASRIESYGEVGKVNISETFYELIKHEPNLSFHYRGVFKVKGKGDIHMYFVSKTKL